MLARDAVKTSNQYVLLLTVCVPPLLIHPLATPLSRVICMHV